MRCLSRKHMSHLRDPFALTIETLQLTYGRNMFYSDVCESCFVEETSKVSQKDRQICAVELLSIFIKAYFRFVNSPSVGAPQKST